MGEGIWSLTSLGVDQRLQACYDNRVGAWVHIFGRLKSTTANPRAKEVVQKAVSKGAAFFSLCAAMLFAARMAGSAREAHMVGIRRRRSCSIFTCAALMRLLGSRSPCVVVLGGLKFIEPVAVDFDPGFSIELTFK